MKILSILCFVLCSFTLLSAAGDFDINMDDARNIFPDPYEKEMRKLRLPEDQLLYLFREKAKASVRFKETKNYKDSLLSKALDDLFRFHSFQYSCELVSGKDSRSGIFDNYLSKLTDPLDKAAFFISVTIRNKNFPKDILAQVPSIISSWKLLEDDKVLSEYCHSHNGNDYYKKTPIWAVPVKVAKDSIEMLVIRIKEKYSLARLIRAVNWLRSSGVFPTQMTMLSEKLVRKLLERCIIEVKSQIDMGISIQSITDILEGPNGLMTRSSLFKNGQLRWFVKEFQEPSSREDIRLFNSICSILKGQLNSLKIPGDYKSGDYIDRMCKTLSDISLVLNMKAKKTGTAYPAALIREFNAIHDFIRSEDVEHLIFSR